MLMQRILRQVSTSISKYATLSNQTIGNQSKTTSHLVTQSNLNDVGICQRRFCSSYETDPQSPYKGTGPQYKYQRYNLKVFDGGILPRPDSYKDKPIEGLPEWNPEDKDQWTEKKALFGQNDYIDILGDGSIHPRDLLTGPEWVRGFNANEYYRTLRRLQFEGEYLKHARPKEYHDLRKVVWFLYKKKITRRKRQPFWSRKGHVYKSRTDKYNDSWEY